MPLPTRRFLAMLWLSLALHAALIGLMRLPPQASTSLPPELRVELAQPAPAWPRPPPAFRPAARARPPARAPQSMPQEAALSRPSSLPARAPASQPALSRPADTAGSVFDLPLLADPRYYAAKELDVQPVASPRPQPDYPAQAQEEGVAGRVVVRLHLEADGSISRTEVVSVTPAGAFGELFRKATLDALNAVRFKPAWRNGQPVRAVLEIPVVFEPGG